MLYKIDEKLNLVSLTDMYNVVVILSSDMFYVRGVIDILQNSIGYKEVEDIDVDEFGIMGTISNNRLGFNSITEYINNVVTPSLFGRHFYVCDYAGLNTNERKRLHEYSKYSNNNGILVVTVSNYSDYNAFMGKDYAISKGTVVLHGFVNKLILKPILKEYLEKNHITWDSENTLELLMYQVGRKHDMYFSLVSRLDGCGGELTYDLLKTELKDLQNVEVLDLLISILRHRSKSKTIRKSKVHTTLDLLLANNTLDSILRKMQYSIDELIKLRQVINQGKIPLIKNLDVDKALVTLGSDFSGISSYKLGKYLDILLDTSLVELLSIKLILSDKSYNELSSYMKILGVINRYSLISEE